MNEAIRYDKGLGDAEVYARLTNATQVYNFSTGAWGSEASGSRVFLTEYPDGSTVQSWYSANLPSIPSGGPYGIDIVRLSIGDTIGNDFISQSTDTAATIDTTSIRVQEVFDSVLQRLAAIKRPIQMDFFSSINTAADIIFRRLLTRKSEIVQGSFSQAVTAPPVYDPTDTYATGALTNYAGRIYSCSTTISVAEAFTAAHWTLVEPTTSSVTVTLPSDFFGFSERPYISGRRGLLEPLPAESRSCLNAPGIPLYYALRGNTMTLFPIPSSDVTVMGQYYRKPSKLTALTDAVPFEGLFDLAVQEAVIDICQMGMAVLVDRNFQTVLYKQIDEVLPFRAPRQIRFRQTIEHGQRTATSPYYSY